MRDCDIAAAIVAGDPAGLATAYDTYGASLHAYCRTLLAEPADAADAVQDTFVIAAAKLGGLRDWDRLRPWLYAVSRNECYRRLRGRARQADLDEAGEMTDASADVGAQAERGELQGLVLAAIGGLNPGDREVIELNLRHDLDGADLADALGVPANQAHALASRARGQLERSLGALLVARTGRRQCAELDAILGDWDGRLTVLLRKRVSRHIEDCETCGARKRRELSPAMLLSVVPLVTLPAGLRHQVLRLVSDSGPEAVGYRNNVAARAEPFADSGFPVQVTPASTAGRSWRGAGRGGGGLGGEGSGGGSADGGAGGGLGRRWSRRVLLGGTVALVVLLGVADATYLLLSNTGHATAAMHQADPTSPVVTTVPSSPTSGPARARSAPRSSRTASPSPPASSSPATPSSPAARSPSPSPSRSRSSPPPSRSPSPSPSPQPDPGTLTESPAVVVLLQSPTGGSSTGAFTLTASGGPVTFAIVVPASESYLSVSPASGKLSAGQSLQVTVTLTPNPTGPAPASSNTLTVNPGGITVTVQYSPAG